MSLMFCGSMTWASETKRFCRHLSSSQRTNENSEQSDSASLVVEAFFFFLPANQMLPGSFSRLFVLVVSMNHNAFCLPHVVWSIQNMLATEITKLEEYETVIKRRLRGCDVEMHLFSKSCFSSRREFGCCFGPHRGFWTLVTEFHIPIFRLALTCMVLPA